MAFTHIVETNVTAAGSSIRQSNTYSGGSQTSIDEPVDDGQTDQLIEFTVNVSEIQSIYIVADVVITLETNSSGAPDDTIVLVAGLPYIWTTDSYYTNLLTTDVTALYLTNASGTDGTFKLEVVFDPTP